MTDGERFIACVPGEPADRTPFLVSFWPWASTRARWIKEGMPESGLKNNCLAFKAL